MSVNDQDGRDDAVGNGATTAFTYTFKIFAKTDIQALVDGTAKVVDTDYTVSGLGASGGGTVTFTTAPASGALVTLLRLQPFDQASVYVANEAFPSARVEKDYDKLVMQIQQLREQVTRALTLAPKEAGTVAKTVLPSATGRASQYLYFDASGNPTTVATVIPAGTPASAFMATVLDDADAAAARTTLGVTEGGVAATLVDVKGDLLVGTAADTVARKAAGADGTALIGLAAAADGLHYQPGVLHGVVLIGGKITVTMAANAVTIAVKTDAGNDPSTTEPVWAWFRSATLTDGASVLRKITAATSTVISSNSTGGTVSGVASRVYVDVIDNAGTVELAWHQPLSGSSLLGFSESALVSTTAEGGAGAADSAGVMYSTTARSTVAFRIAGYFESTQATAGTWATNPSVIQPMGPGVRRTGDMVQRKYTSDGALITVSTVIPYDNSIPQQSTEGTQVLLLAVPPTSALNRLEIEGVANFGQNTNIATVAALFQDTTENALKAVADSPKGSGHEGQLRLFHEMAAGTVSSITFKVFIGPSAAATVYFNGFWGGTQVFNGVSNSYMRITEIFQ